MNMRGRSPKPRGGDSSNFKHGLAIRNGNNHRPPIYISWVGMRTRCRNKRNPDYRYYGGRGINICKRWDSFKNFFEDMGKSYEKHRKNNTFTTLDRIEVNKGYSPKNCRWATRREQSNNRNFNHLITYKGKTQSIGMWASEVPGMTTQNLNHRIVGRKWSLERALTQPLGTKFIPTRWSFKYKSCIKCGTTKRRHCGFGLCNNCYPVERRKKLIKLG